MHRNRPFPIARCLLPAVNRLARLAARPSRLAPKADGDGACHKDHKGHKDGEVLSEVEGQRME